MTLTCANCGHPITTTCELCTALAYCAACYWQAVNALIPAVTGITPEETDR